MPDYEFRTFIVLFLFVLLSNEVVGKSSFSVRVQTPKNVATGSSATLFCFPYPHDVGPIYSIKWYRGNREFFRYMPSEQSPIKLFDFPVGKLHVDKDASNMTQITLRNVSPILSGQYSCEVTIIPSLTTISGNGTLYIYDTYYLRKPVIKTEEHMVDGIKSLSILCGPSIRANAMERIPILFYLNNEEVDRNLVVYNASNGVFTLNTSLFRWTDQKTKIISCHTDLPGTEGLVSDEVHITFDSSGSRRMASDRIIQLWILSSFLLVIWFC